MTSINARLRSLGLRLRLARTQPQPVPNRPAIYQGKVGRMHQVLSPNGETKWVNQRNVITPGALVIDGEVTLVNGMLGAVHSPHVQS